MTDEQLKAIENRSRDYGGVTYDIDALIAEVHRQREWLEGIRDFAERTVPHAMGQGHLALTSVLNAAGLALAGERESDYHHRNREGQNAQMETGSPNPR